MMYGDCQLNWERGVFQKKREKLIGSYQENVSTIFLFKSRACAQYFRFACLHPFSTIL